MGSCLGQGKSSLRLIDPIAKEDVGWLGTTVRSEANDPFECGARQEVWPGLSLEMDALGRQVLNDFGAGQRSLLSEYITDDTDSSLTDILIQAKFCATTLITSNKGRTEQGQEPAEV